MSLVPFPLCTDDEDIPREDPSEPLGPTTAPF